MGRYVLLWVDDNDKVEPILDRLRQWSIVRVVGLYAEPSRFCDGSCGRQTNETWQRANPSIIHPKFGTKHCPLCKRAIKYYGYNLTNALDVPGVPYSMRLLRLHICQTPEGDAVEGRDAWEIFGKKAVKAAIQSEARTKQVIQGYRDSAERRRATRARRRNRRAP